MESNADLNVVFERSEIEWDTDYLEMISFACYHIYNLNKMKIVWIELERSIIKSEQSYSELSVKEVEEYNVDTQIWEKLSKMIDYIYELKGKKGVNWTWSTKKSQSE